MAWPRTFYENVRVSRAIATGFRSPFAASSTRARGLVRSAPAMTADAPRPSTATLLDDTARGCRVTYERDFLSPAEAAQLFATLAREAPFVAEAPVIFGRPRPVRRQSCGYGEPGARYRYTGLERVATPWPAGFATLLDRLGERTGARFTFALCNLYPDGDAGLGWHADDEADLARDAPIASLSLGAERDFAMRRRGESRACLTVPLGHGSLLVMAGATQRHYVHRVPPRVRCREARINLTFRVMR